jgi:hypothetical protein
MSVNNHLSLLSANVNEHIEKKGQLKYLSWSWAWAEALKADSSATFDVKMFGDSPCCFVGQTALVFVTVTMFGKPLMCQLPVMDNRNKAIVNPDSFAVNTAIMRCLAKAIALHGLGLYIYAGEDLPEDVIPERILTITLEQQINIEALAKDVNVAVSAICERAKISNLSELPSSSYDAIIKKLEATRK